MPSFSRRSATRRGWEAAAGRWVMHRRRTARRKESMQDAIAYTDEPALSVDEFIDVLRRSTLAERRPVDDRGRIGRMLVHADIRLCARDAKGVLVGVARAVTDFAYCCYLSDLA